MPHLTLEVYLMVLSGELPPRALVEFGFPHLLQICPSCRSDWDVYRNLPLKAGGAPSPRRSDDDALTSGYGTTATATKSDQHQRGAERRRLRRELRQLLTQPQEVWQQKVATARSRYRSRGFAELLIQESRSRVRREPSIAAALAGLVETVLLWTPGALEQTDSQALRIRALAHQANALRVAGNLVGSDRRFAEARRFLAAGPISDSELHGEVSSLEASLRLEQGRLDEAEHLLARAVLVFGILRSRSSLSRVLVQRAELYRQQDRLDEAVGDLERALLSTDRTDEELLLCAAGALALCLCDVNRPADARRVMEDAEDAWSAAEGSWWSLRQRAIEGRIAYGLGESDPAELVRAERLFEDVLEVCRREERPYEAAVAALDLCLVYLAQGRTAEVRRLARETTPIFRHRSLSRETLAALALVHEAALAETLTRELARQVRRDLDRTAERPAATQPLLDA